MSDDPQGSVASTFFVVVTNVVGAGALSLVAALHSASIIPGIIALVLMGSMAVLAGFFIIMSAEKTGKFTYLELLQLAVSKRAAKIFEVVLFLYTYIILIGWSRIVADGMPPVAMDFFKTARSNPLSSDWLWLLVGGCFFFPLTCLKSLTHLTWTSAAGILSVIYILIVMVIRLADGYYTKNWEPGNDFPCMSWNGSLYVLPENSTNTTNVTLPPMPETGIAHSNLQLVDITFQLIAALPQMSVAWSMHYNLAPCYGELRRRTPLRMFRAVFSAFLFIMCFYVLFSLTGVLTFGDGSTHSKGDILKCYSKTDIPMNIGRILMVFHIICCFPVVGIAVRSRFEAIFFFGKQIGVLQRVLEAFGIVVTTGVIAYVAPGLGIIFELAGAFFGLSIVFIAPSVMAFYILAPDFDVRGALLRAEEENRELLAGDAENNTNKAGSSINDSSSHIAAAMVGEPNISGDDSPRFVASSDAAFGREDYGTLSSTQIMGSVTVGGTSMVDNGDGAGGGADGVGAVSESIPGKWDLVLADVLRSPPSWIRWMALVTGGFGSAATVLAIVNAMRDIAEGKQT